MKAYQEYKESGIKWIGQIPKHWVMANVGRMMNLGRGRVISNIEIGENIGEFPVYSSQTSDNGIMGYINTYDFEGDYVTWTTDGANAGRVFFRTGKFNCTNVCGTMNPKNEKVYLPFIPYLLNLGTKYYVRYDINPKLMNGEMAQIEICLPSIDEQKTIVDFLDRKTAQIDTLIAKKQRQIELLQEQRTALINHAVTKGLNPNAKMKDSGVEWLGEIPSHWYVVPIKRMVDVRDGTHETPDYIDASDVSIPFVTSKDFVDDRIDFSTAKHISLNDHQEFIKRSKVDKWDVLMSMIGGNIGKSVMVDDDYDFSIKNLILFKTHGDIALSKFILYYLKSGLLDVQIDIVSRGGAQSFLSLGDVRNLVFFKIPKAEYVKITKFLDEKNKQIEKELSILAQQINLVQEYRTALISEAVTGKIDVRGDR
ncbi:MAG: restriction endonuclease subunit S [Anaerolineales bacterium]|nr:restriction endonuclease subunit S [Anaerolineales bacterium]